MENNWNDKSQNLEYHLFYMLNYTNSDFMESYSNGFQALPGAEFYGKIPAHNSSGLRNLGSHSCTRE